MKLHLIVSFLFIFINQTLQLNILVILPYDGRSHFMVFDVFIKELARKGHNVTVISHFPTKNPPKNYKDINLAESVIPMDVPFEMKQWSVIKSNYYLTITGIQDCEVLLANKEVQSLIKSRQRFDVAVVEQFNSDCALGVAYKIDAPVVGITSSALQPFHFQRLGLSYNPSSTPFIFLSTGTKPTFVQRLKIVFLQFYINSMYYYTQWMNQRTLAKYFDDIPPLEELGRNIKLFLLYQNFILTGSKLFPSNVIEVGGFHVKKSEPLIGEVQKFVDEAKDGVVYISFGSVVNSTALPQEKKQAFLDAMNIFPQRFIWKLEGETWLADKNKLFTLNWLPQVDILGHPKTLAFVTHGGMSSTTEALHCGVPTIVIPIFGDQPSNAAAVEERGLGVHLEYEELTKDNLVAALKKVLSPEFQKRAKEISNASRDRPTSPLDTAVFWTEFAAKHPNFTFRTAAADVPLYQYIYLDIIATFLVVLGVFGFAIKTICNYRSKPPLKQKQNKIKRK